MAGEESRTIGESKELPGGSGDRREGAMDRRAGLSGAVSRRFLSMDIVEVLLELRTGRAGRLISGPIFGPIFGPDEERLGRLEGADSDTD